MVQNNTQVPMKTSKLKGPPPVPPRPNQSVVAEALAKTRKAVLESRANITKSRINTKQETKIQKSKTLERANSGNSSEPPKQNGLARVKSFIRDVISDRSSSSDEKKSSGTNSRRSSSDSSSTPSSINTKKSTESLNIKAAKTCRQILVRSFSTTSSKGDESKLKVSKSSSFAEKSLPLRKAPPPPLSPKPKLKPMKPLPMHKQRSLEHVDKSSKKRPTELVLYSSPIDAKKSPQSPVSDASYATVEEVRTEEDRLNNSPEIKQSNCNTLAENSVNIVIPGNDQKNNSLERKTSRVTEMLISEILASRNKEDANTVIDKGKDDTSNSTGDESPAIRKDMNNHEMLIYELQTMRSQSNVPENVSEMQKSTQDLEEGETRSVSSECSVESPSSPVSSVPNQEGGDYVNPYACVIDDDLKSRYVSSCILNIIITY